MGKLFAPFSQIASQNPYSASHEAHTAEELVTVTPRNRMIADPYPRMLVSRDQVNQAAALVLTSVGTARQLGIDESKWVYLHGYADLRERGLMERTDLGTSPAAVAASKSALKSAGSVSTRFAISTSTAASHRGFERRRRPRHCP